MTAQMTSRRHFPEYDLYSPLFRNKTNLCASMQIVIQNAAVVILKLVAKKVYKK